MRRGGEQTTKAVETVEKKRKDECYEYENEGTTTNAPGNNQMGV